MIKIYFHNNQIHTVDNSDNFNVYLFVKNINKDREVFGYSVDGVVYDFHTNYTVCDDKDVYLLTWDDIEGRKIFWHSTAHILGAALTCIYGKNRLGTGPAIENGFYYDVDLDDVGFDASHLKKIENKMLELSEKKSYFHREEKSKHDALEYFKDIGNNYKCEILTYIKDDIVTFYRNGDFVDLCRGPHIINTDIIQNIKLTSISSAYWRGNKNNKQMVRIYGISFPDKNKCDDYFSKLSELQKRDHKILGKNLKFFTFSENIGIGLPLWLPRGNYYRKLLVDFLYEEQCNRGYHHVTTPHIAHKKLYITSGHYDKYSEDIFKPICTPNDDEEYFLKPMNCPHHCEIYKYRLRSYKDLPLRIAEFGTVYRYEKHGELQGLSRTRSFTQDDAHIFCREQQVKEEIKNIIDMIVFILSRFHFKDFAIRLSFRDKDNKNKYIGSDNVWENAEKAIKDTIEENGFNFNIAYGEAAFYGPKIDFIINDALGRQWQLGTVQLDYQLPNRFGLEFVNENNEKEVPVMIHRAPLGSIERFTAILLEHTNGYLPLWLSPEQVIILPISCKYKDYAEKVNSILLQNKIRSVINDKNEQLGKKILESESLRIPYLIILGEKEQTNNNLTIRKYGEKSDLTLKLEDLINEIKKQSLQ